MDVTVITSLPKSAKEFDKIIEDIDERKVTIDRDPESVNTSPIVDNINDSINSPYRYFGRNNVKIFRENCAVCLEGKKKTCENISIPATCCTWPAVTNESVKRNGQTVVKDLRNVDSSITSSKILSTVAMEKNKSFKSLRSRRLSCKSKENVSPKTKTRDKPIRTAFTCAKRILLRSSRKRMNGILKKNISQLSGKIFGDDKINTIKRNNKTNLHSSLKDITEKSMNLENDRRQNISDNSSIIKDALISQGIKKEGHANAQIKSVDETTDDRDSIDKKLTINLPSASFDLVQNETSPKKTYQMRKRKEPFNNEHIDKQQIQSSILTKNENDCKCFSKGVEEMEKYDNSKPDKVSPKELVIICTPDINIDVCTEDRKVHKTTEEFSKNDSDVLENGKNKLKTSSENIKFGERFTRHSKREGQETPDGSPKRKLRHTSAQTMPVCKSRIAVAKNETSMRMESVVLPQTIHTSSNNSDCKRDEHKLAEDLLSPDKDTPIPPKNVSINLVNTKKPANKLPCRESVISPQKEEEDEDTDTVGCKKNEREQEDPLAQSVSVGKKIGKCKDSGYSYHPSTDSDETLSNVESIESSPTSPAHEALRVVTAKNRRNISKKRIEPRNAEQINTSEKDVSSILQRLSANIRVTNITDCVKKDIRSTGKTRKPTKTEISSTSSSGTEKQKSKRRDGIKFQFSPNKNFSSSDESGKKFKGDVENDENLDIQRSISWLRHYERPRRTQIEITKDIAEVEKHERITRVGKTPQNLSCREKINISTGGLVSENRRQENKQGIAGYVASKEKNNNNLNTNNQTNVRKRGRPRKQTTEQSNPDLKKNKKARIDKDSSQLNHEQSSPTVDRSNMERNANEQFSNGTPVLNGSALTLLELQHLFFKFLQHGHFRIDFEQSTINIQNVNSHQNCTTRMRCYDQKEYYMPQNCNLDVTNFENTMNPQLNKCFQTDNSSNGIYRTKTSNFDPIDHKFESMNPNLNLNTKFSDGFGSQMSYSSNTSHCNTQVGTSCYENLGTGVIDGIDRAANDKNLWNYNSTVPANTNSLYNCAQSGYTKESNYQQDFYNNNNDNNNNDLLDNNSYAHCYSGITNSNDSMNNGNIGTDGVNILSSINNINDTSFDQSIQNRRQNSMPLVKMDSGMSDGNRMSRSSTISMRNNSFLNDLNTDWCFNNVNQQLDSANEYSMDQNMMGCDNKQSQASGSISDTSNLIYDSNLIINDSNLWMNRANNTMNPGFSVMRPWHEPLPVYNPYLNNENLHYGDMFSSCGAFVGFNSSNYPFLNGGNNADPWMQNTFSSTDNEGNSATHISSNGQFSGMSSSLYQTNNNLGFTEGMNLTLPSDALGNTTIEAMNMIDPNGDNLDIANGNKLNSTIEQFSENFASLIETNENNKMQGISQLSDSYSIEYENCRKSLDFNGTPDGGVSTDVENNISNQKRENLLEIHDYVDKKLENFENCFDENYTELTNCKTLIAQSNNNENELSKLRQELADFTKQYSENQMGPDSTKIGLNTSTMIEKYEN